MALVLTNDNFKTEILDYSGVALVDFWAPWCGPCKMVAPVIEKLAEEYEGKAKIAKVNVDENEELSNRFDIMSIPTFIIFKNGQAVDKMVGANSKQAIEDRLGKWLQ